MRFLNIKIQNMKSSQHINPVWSAQHISIPSLTFGRPVMAAVILFSLPKIPQKPLIKFAIRFLPPVAASFLFLCVFLFPSKHYLRGIVPEQI